MRYAELILPEFEQEIANTRKLLQCVPDESMDWRAGPNFNTIGWNANHLAEIIGWVDGVLTQTSWDMAPVGGEAYRSPALATGQAVLELFDRNVAAARAAIQRVDEAELSTPWSLLAGGQPLFTLPRSGVIRTFVLNHLIHHRAILSTYLRMIDVAVPGMYGPTGDAAGAEASAGEPQPQPS